MGLVTEASLTNHPPVTIGYFRAGESLDITFANDVSVWDVIDYLSANFQKPNAAADARLDAVLAAREVVAPVVENKRRANGRK